jgi:alpha-galactosidase/6-phospho-beta-glucosidase family protein
MATIKNSPGLWLFIFNVVVFLVACLILIIGVKFVPSVRIFSIALLVGVLLVNAHSAFRYWQYDKDKKKQRLQQQLNIVPGHCPDYWTKTIRDNKVYCKNSFVGLDAKGDPLSYRFGNQKTANEVGLNTIASMKNEEKCRIYGNSTVDGAVPWVELQNKCGVGSFSSVLPNTATCK